MNNKNSTMKKILLFFIMMCCASSYAQTIIQMEEYGGVYRIPCKVNGAKMKLIFDTGAESVCLSLTMAEYLFDNDFISSVDIIGTGTSSVADGRIVDHVIINIRDIEIEGIHLTNVRAVVIDGQNAPLLLGQSAIQKLGSIEINGNVLIIKNGNNSNDDEYIDQLFEEAKQAYENKLYSRAVEKYGQLYALNQLSDYGLYKYAWACYMNDDLKKAEELVNSINNYAWFEENKVDIYRLMGHISSARHKYTEAVNLYEMSSKKIQTEEEEWVVNLRWQADCYYYADMYTSAAERYRYAAMLFAMTKGVDMAYLQRDSKNRLKKNEKSYRNDDIDYILYQLFYCNERSGSWSTDGFLFEATAMARAGNKYALKMCNQVGIDPYSSAWR